MKELHFSDWHQCLIRYRLPQRQRKSFEITIRWFLGFCRRSRAQVTTQSARDFIEWASREKEPESWRLEDWKEAIRPALGER
ncbi:MAG: hypothetical protein O2960_19685 [Verrucomicrobia bacterium]|nr:hypothetical protein [Verrucomicrobiota bacterium]